MQHPSHHHPHWPPSTPNNNGSSSSSQQQHNNSMSASGNHNYPSSSSSSYPPSPPNGSGNGGGGGNIFRRPHTPNDHYSTGGYGPPPGEFPLLSWPFDFCTGWIRALIDFVKVVLYLSWYVWLFCIFRGVFALCFYITVRKTLRGAIQATIFCLLQKLQQKHCYDATLYTFQ